MAVIIGDNFQFDSTKNNFERDYFEVLHNVVDPDTGAVLKKGMLDVNKKKMPQMFISYCKETGKAYLYNKDNDNDPTWGYWREIPANSTPGSDSNLKYYATIQDMVEDTITYDVALGYVAEDEKTYMYLSTNDPDPTTGKWRVFITGSVNKEMVRCTAVEVIDPLNPPTSGYNNGDYLYDCTNDIVYLYSATWVEDRPGTGHYVYSFEEIAEVPSGTTPTDVVDITQVSATVSTVGDYYHDTTTDKYYIGIQTWVEDTPGTGHYEYSVTDVTDNVTMFECTITESLYENLDNEVKMRDVTWYVD